MKKNIPWIVIALVMLASVADAAKPVFNFKGGVKTRADKGLTKDEIKPQTSDTTFFTTTYTFVVYLDDDSSAMIQFTYWKISIINNHALFFSFIDKGDKQYLYKPVFDEDDFSYKADPQEFRLGQNYWKGTYPDFFIHAEFPASDDQPTMKADLHFKSRTPGWRPGEGPVHYGSPDGDWYDLIVLIPWADVDGTLVIDGKVRKVKGFGYSDHNTQTVFPTSQLGEILAVRSFSDDYSIDFLEYVAPEKYGRERTTWILIMKGDRILYATDKWSRELHDYEVEEKYGHKYPTRVTLEIDQPGCKLAGEVKAIKVIETIDAMDELPSFVRAIAKLFFEAPVIIRHNAVVDWHLVMPENGIDEKFTNKGVFEITIVR